MIVKQSKIAISTFFLREIDALSKRKSNKEMKLMTWIKEKQEMKQMQRMSATEMIVLTRESDIKDTLTARKNIVEVKKFKKLMIFKIIFEESKKILKFNDFWIKNVVLTAILRRERSEMMIHKIKIKSMFQDIKNDETKMMKKVDEIMHSKLQIENVKWFAKNCNKKKYALMIAWMRDAKIANRLIQLKLIMKLNIKTMKYYKRNCKIKQCTKCQKYDHWTYVCKNK